jgi:hypothetical protein
VRLQLGQVPVGQTSQLLDSLVSDQRAKRVATVSHPGCLAFDGRPEHSVLGEGIEASRRFRLIQNLVGAVAGGFDSRRSAGHDNTP